MGYCRDAYKWCPNAPSCCEIREEGVPTDADVASLFRHILSESQCTMDDFDSIILLDTSWVDVDEAQYAVWRSLRSEIE